MVDYARYLRWGQLKARYYGKIDARVGMTMESDTFDSYLNKDLPDARDICGEPEYVTPGLLDWDSWVLDPEGATDGKVCTESMALHGLKSWACWGHGSGDHFDAAAYLAANPDWASDQRRAGGVRPEDLLGPVHRPLAAAHGQPVSQNGPRRLGAQRSHACLSGDDAVDRRH